ncbi:hypothetical protein CAMGR0001_1038 [Campylobacter gracilis RM3268]|uniref:Uncharacterized protein n=1 Tax=Campylobacter gracilis RM3268 TaxID=553220 RepID=C8PGP3_9BACT|nr:hypothetical protein CAMGR0001_1038 [Campylobacter gracilis RM3268]
MTTHRSLKHKISKCFDLQLRVRICVGANSQHQISKCGAKFIF